MTKSPWNKPSLVRKPLSETLSGAGSNADGQGGEVQS
jgi:hypothetical protein